MITNARNSLRSRYAALVEPVLLTLSAVPAQVTQIYTAQGDVDFAMNGAGFRLQNASTTGTCSATPDANCRAASRTFNATFPATATGIDCAFPVWGGSYDARKPLRQLNINGGVGANVSGATQAAASPTVQFRSSNRATLHSSKK